jgi:DNA-binding beta-propeller fold protein YncE
VLRRPSRPVSAVLALSALAVVVAATPATAAPQPRTFAPLATVAVSGEVAEILSATPDGRTVLYTDSELGQVGLVDISVPTAPRQLGTVDVGGSPTSVAVTPGGRYALVVVDDTTDLTRPAGHLAVVDLTTRTVVRTIDLGGQPDSVDIGPSGVFAAIAIENQRDEDLEVGGVEGGLPQLPAGYLSVVDLRGTVAQWTVGQVSLTGLPGALFADDPEPEFVDVNGADVAAVTLQENNAVALVDLARRRVVSSFSAGTVTRTDADTTDDETIAFDDTLVAPREPDAVQWTARGNLVTADEGDLAAEPSGGRGWTVFSPAGSVLFASGGSAEKALAVAGRYPDGRSDDKGAEFEGAEVARMRGTDYTLIGSERGDAVLVYEHGRDAAPQLLQVLPTGDAPEGLLAIESRELFLTSNEGDGTLSVFGLR